jgi:hypothetical protein
MAQERSTSGGIGASGLLGVLFVGLKLTHYIDWSWWWVTLPFWAPIAVVLVLLAVMGITAATMAVVAWVTR